MDQEYPQCPSKELLERNLLPPSLVKNQTCIKAVVDEIKQILTDIKPKIDRLNTLHLEWQEINSQVVDEYDDWRLQNWPTLGSIVDTVSVDQDEDLRWALEYLINSYNDTETATHA